MDEVPFPFHVVTRDDAQQTVNVGTGRPDDFKYPDGSRGLLLLEVLVLVSVEVDVMVLF